MEAKEETNFKYLRCRLDFNMYYQLKQMQEAGNDEQMDDEELGSDYGDEAGNMEYGSQEDDDEEDIGVHNQDSGDDDDNNWITKNK